MKTKTIVTAGLLAFVAASVVALIAKEFHSAPQVAPAIQPAGHKVIAYYFHGNVRCLTCRAIEAQTQEAIQSNFPDALREGQLEWRVVNLDSPGNEHFVKDYELTTRSVVLVELRDGKQARWLNLPRVWDLVHTPPALGEYITTETRRFLEQS